MDHTASRDPCRPRGTDGALTVDVELDSVLLGLRALALAQEDALVVGGDVCQGQSSPSVQEAEPVLVLAGFALALALAHAEDESRLLLVDLRRGSGGEGRVLGLREGDSLPPCHPATLSTHSQKTSPRG